MILLRVGAIPLPTKPTTKMKIIEQIDTNSPMNAAMHTVMRARKSGLITHLFEVPVAWTVTKGKGATEYVNVCEHEAAGVYALYDFYNHRFLGYVLVDEGAANIRTFTRVPDGYRPRVEWAYKPKWGHSEYYVGSVMHTTDSHPRPVFVNDEQLTWRQDIRELLFEKE